jgi:hypothetical protein
VPEGERLLEKSLFVEPGKEETLLYLQMIQYIKGLEMG